MVIKKTIELVESVKKDYLANVELQVIASKYDICVGTITNWMKEEKVFKSKHFISQEEKDSMVAMYKGGASLTELRTKMSRSHTTVVKILLDAGIVRNTGNHTNIKACNHSYFSSIETEEQAYWLGFLFADGNVIGNSISIGLKHSDYLHLVKFRKALGIRKMVTVDDVRCRIGVRSTQLAEDLAKLGCVPKKSLILKFPENLPSHLVRHFSRGYFDGDGSLGNYHSAAFMLIGTNDFLLKFIEYNNFPEKKKDLPGDKRYQNPFTKYLQYSGKNAANVIKYLYKDSTVFLDRKYKIYEEIVCRYKKKLL